MVIELETIGEKEWWRSTSAKFLSLGKLFTNNTQRPFLLIAGPCVLFPCTDVHTQKQLSCSHTDELLEQEKSDSPGIILS